MPCMPCPQGRAGRKNFFKAGHRAGQGKVDQGKGQGRAEKSAL